MRISGRGPIDGRGQKWWDRYWTMRRADDEPRGLRWAVDYDARRVRLLVAARSSDVTIEQARLRFTAPSGAPVRLVDVETDGVPVVVQR